MVRFTSPACHSPTKSAALPVGLEDGSGADQEAGPASMVLPGLPDKGKQPAQVADSPRFAVPLSNSGRSDLSGTSGLSSVACSAPQPSGAAAAGGLQDLFGKAALPPAFVFRGDASPSNPARQYVRRRKNVCPRKPKGNQASTSALQQSASSTKPAEQTADWAEATVPGAQAVSGKRPSVAARVGTTRPADQTARPTARTAPVLTGSSPPLTPVPVDVRTLSLYQAVVHLLQRLSQACSGRSHAQSLTCAPGIPEAWQPAVDALERFACPISRTFQPLAGQLKACVDSSAELESKLASMRLPGGDCSEQALTARNRLRQRLHVGLLDALQTAQHSVAVRLAVRGGREAGGEVPNVSLQLEQSSSSVALTEVIARHSMAAEATKLAMESAGIAADSANASAGAPQAGSSTRQMPAPSTSQPAPPQVCAELRTRCGLALADVLEWRDRHLQPEVYQRSDVALQKLASSVQASILSLTLSSGNEAPAAHEEARAAAAQVDLALAAESLHGKLSKPEDDFPKQSLAAAVQSLHDFHTSHLRRAESMKERLEWASQELSRQSEASGQKYPPPLDTLTGAQSRLYELQDRLEEKELRIKQRERRGAPVGDSVAEVAELRAILKAERLDIIIMKERARLFSLAHTHFPELLAPGHPWGKLVGLEQSDVMLAVKSRGLLAEGRRLAEFTFEEVVSHKPGGRCIRRAVDCEGRVWALKEFSLADSNATRQFWKHVALLDDLRHPKLATVCAVFADSARGSAFLQMPWYSGGDLGAWLSATPATARDISQCKLMLGDAVEALHHLHSRGQCHCDIKPPNMFLTPGLRLVLGDFDGVASITGTQTINFQGGTLGYLAPEIVSGTLQRFNPQSDIYAIGVVASELLTGVKMTDGQRRLMEALVQAATHDDASVRPSAEELCHHPFLSASEQHDPVASCVVCWDVYRQADGVSCSEQGRSHLVCAECVAGYVTSLSTSETARHVALAKREGRLLCPGEACRGELRPEDVARHVPAEVHSQYMAAVRGGVEGHMTMEMELQLHQLRHELHEAQQKAQASTALEAKAQMAEMHVVENILTTKCPRCHQAFYDFTGCFALTCSRCQAGICGWCLQDCGNDAHAHVRGCRLNQSPGDPLFAPVSVYEASCNARRSREVKEYLAPLHADLRDAVIQKLRPHLTDLGIAAVLDA